MELGAADEVRKIANQIEARSLPPPNRAQAIVLIRQIAQMADVIEKLEAERDALKMTNQILDETARGYLADRSESRQECERLRLLCQSAHDCLLRGDEDKELLEMLEQAWTHNAKSEPTAPLLAQVGSTDGLESAPITEKE